VAPESSDPELLRRAQDDPVAFELLYHRHVGRVIAYAARRCREPQDAADLVAATFVRVIEAAHTYDEKRGEVLPWIIGIESNLLADRGRRAYREREVLERTLGQRPLDEDEYARLEERIDAARESREVERALASLDPRHREALLLVAHDGLSDKQAAAALRVTPTAFRMRLSRARRALRAALAGAPDQEPEMEEVA
jgi:RNA polymerase sigma-70 factor (ECF subfamily)